MAENNPSSSSPSCENNDNHETIRIPSVIKGRHHWTTPIKIGETYEVRAHPNNKHSNVACRVVKGKSKRTGGFVPERPEQLANILFPALKKKNIKVSCKVTGEEKMLGYDNGQGIVRPCTYNVKWLGSADEKEIILHKLKTANFL